MKNTIWKFPLEVADAQGIAMPAGATVLTVQTQNGAPCLWARVDADAGTEIREFAVFGMGHSMPADLSTYNYVGTFGTHGQFVWHLYEVIDGVF